MEELSKTITDYTEAGVDNSHLQSAAKKWADHCLSNYVGDLLAKGLAISAALANFTAEMEDRK